MILAETYELDGTIADAGLVVDSEGDAWKIDTHEFKVGDKVVIKLNDRGTPNFKDDKIIGLTPIKF
jgi:hypothetical protein